MIKSHSRRHRALYLLKGNNAHYERRPITTIITPGSTIYEVRYADTNTPIMLISRFSLRQRPTPMRFATRSAAEAAVRNERGYRPLTIVEVTL